MALDTESQFFRLRDSPEGSARRRLIIFGAIGVTCLLLFIHHIRLEVAARHRGPEKASGSRHSSSEEAYRSRLELLESKHEAVAASLGWKDCGGYIPLPSQSDLVFQVPPNGMPHGCVWIIASRASSGPIMVRLVQDDHFRFNSNFSLRVVTHSALNTCNAASLRLDTGEQTYSSGMIMVFFNGQSFTPGEGFRLKITDGSRSPDQKRILFLRKEGSFSHKYPPGYGTTYGNNEIFLLLGEASQEKKVNVTISGIRTEPGADWVSLIWMHPTRSTQPFCRSGSGEQSADVRGIVPAATPFLIFFRSDGSVAREGFNVRAMYYDE